MIQYSENLLHGRNTMAGLLLELRRQLARNRRQTTYHKPNVYTLKPQNERHVTESVEETTQELPKEVPEEPKDGNIQERNVGVVSKEDFLLSQIDEFRERAKQLQSLLDTKETEAQELQTLVDERQEKADALDQILQERQEKADGLTIEVEKQIDSIIAKVAAKMDEIEATMKDDVADGKRFNEEKARELKESLEQVQEQLTVVKNDLSEKVHSENVKCYRNVQDLFRSMDEKVDRLTQIEAKMTRTQGLVTVSLVFGILNFGILIALLLMNLGVLGL